jgi:spore germination protein GerM
VRRRRIIQAVVGLTVLVLAAWGLTVALERVMSGDRTTPVSTQPPASHGTQAPVRHITATLFYGAEDGQFLVPVQREVAFGPDPLEQGRLIVLAQLQQPAPSGLVSAIPPGTTLRRFYVTDRGDAFVDLGPEITTTHPGGSVAELFTVYAIVNAVTANLPAISRVQILVDGREVDTLAGHVDLRRPLEQNDTLVRQDSSQ